MRAVWLLALALLLAVGSAAAQDAPVAPQPVDNFSKLFPSPTGQNGYEEFVAAADLVSNDTAWKELEQNLGDANLDTLAAKRQVVGDLRVQRVLDLIREGLRKPIHSPHLTVDDQTTFPQLAPFRSVARLIYVDMYVLLADGKVGEAIALLGDALRFSYDIQKDTLIAGLVGIAIDAITIRSLARHLDQMSARDCDQLLALAQDWMSVPDPAIEVINGERKAMLNTLRKYRSSPTDLVSVSSVDASDEQKQENGRLAERLRGNPDAAAATMDQVAGMVNAYYDRVTAELQKPVWERKIPEPPKKDGSVGAALLNLVLPATVQVNEKFARDQAQVQLLGVHAAIRRYLWEHDALPPSLDVLRLGRLALDPFSGKPLAYRVTGARTYDLSSIGPTAPTAPDQPSSGQRVPVRLP